MRSTLKTALLAPALLLAAACSKNDRPVAADSALNTDLSLASQARSAPLDSVTAAERLRYDSAARAAVAPTALTRSPTPVASSHPTTHTSTASRSTHTHAARSRSSGTVHTSSGGNVVYREPRVEVHKNTKRDAAIGAAAGAVIGGAKGGVKGGLIGAAVGGILGGVIGNNVDVQKKRVP